MERTYFEDRRYEKEDFTTKPLVRGEYDHCKFINCNFAGIDLSGIHFTECVFDRCNMSMAKLEKTTLRDIKFTNCKLLGLRFDDCDTFLFSASFDRCQLNLCSFFEVKMKKTIFTHCSMHETDFTGTDLSAAKLDHCDLLHARFDHTILEKADLSTAINYSIDPENNKIKGAKFSLPAATGLLDKYEIELK